MATIRDLLSADERPPPPDGGSAGERVCSPTAHTSRAAMARTARSRSPALSAGPATWRQRVPSQCNTRGCVMPSVSVNTPTAQASVRVRVVTPYKRLCASPCAGAGQGSQAWPSSRATRGSAAAALLYGSAVFAPTAQKSPAAPAIAVSGPWLGLMAAAQWEPQPGSASGAMWATRRSGLRESANPAMPARSNPSSHKIHDRCIPSLSSGTDRRAPSGFSKARIASARRSGKSAGGDKSGNKSG